MSSSIGSWETFRALSTIMGLLGTTKASLWPFLERTGQLVSGLSVGDLIPHETAGAAEDLEHDFAPIEHAGKVHSYHFHPTGDHHLAGIDNDAYSFGDGAADVAFSVGAWIFPNVVNDNTILAKYDSAGSLEEYRFFIDAAGKLSLELHDASASTKEVAASTAALLAGRQHFVVAAYDGGEASPVVNLYVDGVLANDGTTAETGAYVAMENGAAPLTVGCAGVTALPTTEFHGRIALPFVTGKQLSAVEVGQLFEVYRVLLGI